MEKIKVLIVDDSALIRRLISEAIEEEADMEVIDIARDGEEALEKISNCNPDVITLDIQMPKKNGHQVLDEILKLSNFNTMFQIVVISGSLKEHRDDIMDLLQKGVIDFIEKEYGDVSSSIEKIKKDVTRKIRLAYNFKKKTEQINKSRFGRMEGTDSTKNTAINLPKNRSFKALVIGASTGGPKALLEVIRNIPGNINIPVLIVQHMPAGFTKSFAERMNNNSALTVVEAQDGEFIRPNFAYLAPGGFHMMVDRGKIKLDKSPQIHGVRPAVDILFLSAIQEYGSDILACILTGMGKDGAAGVKAIKHKGGYVIAQDEFSSIVYGMPKAAFETGCVDTVLPLSDISSTLTKIIKGV